eukprot:gene6491-6718_t
MADRECPHVAKVIMVQDPTMQLRTHASFIKWWQQEPPIEIISYSPLHPQLQVSADGSQLEFVPDSISMSIPGNGHQLQHQQQNQQQDDKATAAADATNTAGCTAERSSESAAAQPMSLSRQHGVWEVERFISLLLGEIPRLRDAPGGYGPKGSGFIGHVDIPVEVEAAHAWLAERYHHLLRA